VTRRALRPIGVDAPCRPRDERAGRDLGAVVEGGDLEVGEHVGHLALQLAQALDGQRRISTSACSVARIAMKCRQAR
jgi:hypothetical protein